MGKAKERRAAFQRGTGISPERAVKQFAQVVENAQAKRQRTVLTRRGKTVAAIVPPEDLELLERLDDLAESEMFRVALAEWEHDGRRTSTLDEVSARLRD